MADKISKPRIHKVWLVRIGSRHDANPIDQFARAAYRIESSFKNGIPTIQRRALKLATEDGIPSPVVLSVEWINHP